MEVKEKKQSRLSQLMKKLRIRYRFVVVDDATFDEKWSVRLSPMFFLLFFGGGAIVIVSLTILLIAYTPLREYIPGYPDGTERQKIIDNNIAIDSLETKLARQQNYINRVTVILNGGVIPDEGVDKDSVTNPPQSSELANASENEKALRLKIDKNEEGVFGSKTKINSGAGNIYFYVPVNGEISSSFNRSKNHIGTDISTSKETPVKAALDGTIIFAGYSADGGHELHIQHSENLITIYKHNEVLFKRTGDRVSGGETIALSGNTGSESGGNHLHFEIWDNGIAVDPEKYVGF